MAYHDNVVDVFEFIIIFIIYKIYKAFFSYVKSFCVVMLLSYSVPRL